MLKQGALPTSSNLILVSEEWLSNYHQELKNEINSLKELITKVIDGKTVEKWYIKEELMKILDVCDKTLEKKFKSGEIAYTQHGAKKYIKASDVDAYLNRNYIRKKD